jgi:predicted NAD/FAD-binding protein
MRISKLLAVAGAVAMMLMAGTTAEAQMRGGLRHDAKRVERHRDSRPRVPARSRARDAGRSLGPQGPIHERAPLTGPCYHGMIYSPCSTPGPSIRIEIGGHR